jgi:flagellar FliL protein
MAKDKKAQAEAEAPEADGEGAAKKGGFPFQEAHHHGGGRTAGRRRRSRGLLLLHQEAARGKAGTGCREGAADLRRSARSDGQSAGRGRGRSSYLKAKIVLEVEDAKLADQVRPLLPRVMDAFQTYLREMRSSDLEGSAGLYRVRDELTRRVNLAVAPSKINAVLFKEIVVQ